MGRTETRLLEGYAKKDLKYSVHAIADDLEVLVVDVHGMETLRTINYYLPAEVNVKQKQVFKSQPGSTIWCADFNAHNVVWHSELTVDARSTENEEAISESNFVVLNDYEPIRRPLMEIKSSHSMALQK